LALCARDQRREHQQRYRAGGGRAGEDDLAHPEQGQHQGERAAAPDPVGR
jgi:hypothetical protein